MTWIKTETDDQSRESSVEFWKKIQNDLNNEMFWADKIKKLRGEPVKRLKLAIENLPLPAAFREATIALRVLIRQKKKENISFNEELTLLYWLTAIDSFSIPYSIYLQEPGFNIIESIPGKIIKSLSFSYYELGYKKLKLLNKTDIKWCIDIWGDTKEHTTLHDIHIGIWRKYERALLIKRKSESKL